jgi:co-chaperonin GroES (HSP10)
MSSLFATKIEKLIPLKDYVIVKDMNFSGRKLSSGIVLLGDDGNTSGIRPRWAQVYAVGPEQSIVKAGEWVLVEHGRWTRGVEVEITGEEMTLRRVDPKNIIFVSDQEPSGDDTISTAVAAQQKSL